MTNSSPSPVLFVFRRDLRLHDSTALNAALSSGAPVLAAFFGDPRQTDPHPYRSEFGLRFLAGALLDLQNALAAVGGRLYLFRGRPEEVVPTLVQQLGIRAVFVNKDYTPFSRARDRALSEAVSARGASFHSFSDLLLLEPAKFSKPDGTPYTVFTPFYKRGAPLSVAAPKPREPGNFYSGEIAGSVMTVGEVLGLSGTARSVREGVFSEAQRLLNRATQLSQYQDTRDFPALEATTTLSPHHKFGTLSIREVYHRLVTALGASSGLVRQLYWRDFFTHIAWHFPHVFEGAFQRHFDAIEWPGTEANFLRWTEGTTGFPIVDAGMRELTETGSMHNRVRMVVASFLVKDLHCNWQQGERFFARYLTDYDPCVNNGSWQWAASTGCNAQPYFRIFNPWLQQKRFDAECHYIKRWVPELSGLSASEIQSLSTSGAARPRGYPAPIVDHQEAKIVAEELFAEVVRRRAGESNGPGAEPLE